MPAMGSLRRLEVQNFKSYQGDHVIGAGYGMNASEGCLVDREAFSSSPRKVHHAMRDALVLIQERPFADFTAVIGPNGAGKSNVMDAISFVLGVATGSLRGTKLSDLIYRPEGEKLDQQTREATVALVYHDAKKDEEVFLSRTIAPTGGSDYKINKKKVTYDEFDKRLKSYGILVKARNFLVFQGDVEAMAAKKGKELAETFEIISGSDELQSSYNTLKAEKAEKDEALIHASSKTKTLRAEKKVVKEQKKEAEQFNTLVEHETQLKSHHQLWQLFQLEAEIRENCAKCVDKQGEMDQATETAQKCEDALKEKVQERAKHNRQEKQQQKKMDDLRKAIQKQQPRRVDIEEKIVHTEKRTKTLQEQTKKLNKSVEIHNKAVRRFASELEELEQSAEEFEAEAAAKGGSTLNLGASQKEKYEKIKHQAGVKTAKLRGEVKEVERAKSRHAKKFEGLDADMEQLAKQKKHTEEKHRTLAERQEKLSDQISKQEEELHGKEAALATFRGQKDKTREREQKLQEKIYKSEQVLQDARSDSRESKNETRGRESLDALKRLFPGVKGRVIDLCEIVDRKYNLAVTVTMGREMDSVVVDTKETAMQCIDYLKSQHMGRMTFIPLAVDAKPTDDSIRRACSQSNSRRMVIDVIRGEKEIDNVLRYACGNAVICPTVNDARKLCFQGASRVKAVTLGGVVIAKNGNMTGGQSDNESRSQRWDRSEVEALKQKHEKWRSELAEIQQGGSFHEKEANMQSEISAMKSQIKLLQNDVALNAEKIKKNQENVVSATKELKKLKPKHVEAQQELDEQKEKMSSIQQKIGMIEEELFKDFSAEVGVNNIREYEETQLIQAKLESEKRLKYRKNINKLKNQLELEKSRDRSDEQIKLTAKMKEDESKLENLEAELQKCADEVAQLESQFDELKEQAGEQDDESKEVDIKIKALRKEADDSKAALSSHKKELGTQETATEQVRNKRLKIFQESLLEEIKIPVCDASASGSSGRAEGSQKRRRVSTSSTERNYESSEPFNPDASDQEGDASGPAPKQVCIDFSTIVDDERRALTAEQYDAICDKYREELKGLILELESLSPNARALEKFADVEGRLKSVVDEFDDSKQAAEEASKKFDAVKKKRFLLFMKAFEHVAGCIETIYKDLTKTESNPQGGTAVLTLEDEDEPYLHGVRFYPQPPYKGFREIEQLSGGEKSIAALALLFAIHSFHPSPFFVLDEVDAALDSNNVRQVARYINSRKHDFQSIVISLKDQFYENADVLVGVAKDRPSQSSAVYTLDLLAYDGAVPVA